MSFTSDIGINVLENLAADRAREFLRPKSPTEQLQYIVMVLWFLLAFLTSQQLQFYGFIILISLILVNTGRSFFIKEVENRPLAGSILRLALFFWLYIYIKNPDGGVLKLTEQIVIDDIFFTQKLILGGLFIIGLLTRNLRLKLLVSAKIDDYFDFLGGILSAIAQISLVVILLYSWNFVPQQLFEEIPSDFLGFTILEVIIIAGLIAYFLSSLSPLGQTYRRLERAKSLVMIQSSRLERFRFSALSAGFLLIILDLLKIINSNPAYPHYRNFVDFGVVLFVIGLLLFIFGTGTGRKSGTDFWESLKKGQIPSADLIKESLPKSIIDAKESIKDKIIDENQQQFYKLNKDFPVINNEKIKNRLTMKKDAIAIPVSETKDGVTVVFVGESDLENKENKDTDSGSTTLLISNDQWQNIYSNLEAIKPSEELIQSLALKGVESKEKLISIANQALEGFKNWQGPKALVAEANIQAFLDSVQSGKYGVTEEGGYSKVRLPGITVIESPEIQFVNILGIIKVLEIPALGLNSVDLPFLKVMESRDYEFVQGPGFTVLETPDGNIVNVFGMNFSEGDKKLVASKISQIAEDQQSLNRLMAGPLEDILDDPNKTLALSQSLSGERKMLMSGTEDSIIEDATSSSLTRKEFKKQKERGKRDRRRHEKQKKRKMKGSMVVTFDTDSKKLVKIDKNAEEIITPEVVEEKSAFKEKAKTLVIKDSGDLPICKMCNKEVEEVKEGIRCPHCNEFFHRSHYLKWIRDVGECYSCKNPLNMEFE